MLEAINFKKVDYLRGRSLLPLLQGGSRPGPEVVMSESHSGGNCTGSFMIRKGDWKYIYFSGYEGLLFNLKEDPHEISNLINDSANKAIPEELRKELFARVKPDEITVAAFRKQKEMRDQLVKELTAEELIEKLKDRLGEGQSDVITTQLKSDIY